MGSASAKRWLKERSLASRKQALIYFPAAQIVRFAQGSLSAGIVFQVYVGHAHLRVRFVKIRVSLHGPLELGDASAVVRLVI